ncbi:uncharacterized protein LOC142554432 [Primulina tabacum]|uniref:uncharacterized protein LOC142554432 n=1 Tax=Primulina tabacum TaxID=48773 RepID=UPI003F5AD531
MSLEQISRFRVAEVNKHGQIHLGGSAQQVVNRNKLLFNRNNYQFSNECKLAWHVRCTIPQGYSHVHGLYTNRCNVAVLIKLECCPHCLHLYAPPTTGQAPYYGHHPHNARLLSVST